MTPEQRRAYGAVINKRFYDRNKVKPAAVAKMAADNKRWRAQHPEKTMFDQAKKRARAKGLEFSIAVSDIIVPAVCPVLGFPLVAGGRGRGVAKSFDSPSLDRINNLLGYVPGNVRVISFRANQLKSSATVRELELILEYVRGLR